VRDLFPGGAGTYLLNTRGSPPQSHREAVHGGGEPRYEAPLPPTLPRRSSRSR